MGPARSKIVTAAEDFPAPLEAEGTYIWIDSDQCIRCANCIRICPTEAISLRKADLVPCAGGNGRSRT